MGNSKFSPNIVDIDGDADYRSYFDSEAFRVWHLEGKARTFKIAGIAQIETKFMGAKELRPLLHLIDRDGVVQLPLTLNKTNSKTIAQLYGKKPRQWIGRLITLYPTTTETRDGMADCIRIKPQDPATAKAGKPAARANKQGANVIPSPAKAPPAAAVTESPERQPGDDEDETDEDEPPTGALESDNVIQ